MYIFFFQNGTFLGAISLAVMLAGAGILIFLTHMSRGFYIFSFTSYLRFTAQGLVNAIYAKRDNIPCPDDVTYCHYTSPEVFLKEIGMAEDTYWLCAAILCLNIIVIRVVTFCTLKRRLSGG